MEPRTFLASLAGLIRTRLAAELRESRSKAQWGLLKLFYGNPRLHYEANLHPKTQTVEIGLHFEEDEFTNARLLGAFRRHEREIHRELPGARLEEWDKGWTRIWEPIAYEALDATLQRDVAERIARYITTLEPILREELPSDVHWKVTRTRSSDRPR